MVQIQKVAGMEPLASEYMGPDHLATIDRMNSTVTAVAPDDKSAGTIAPQQRVFWEWCLRREVFLIAPLVLLVVPLAVTELHMTFFWQSSRSVLRGPDVLRGLFGIAAMMVVGGGAVHAAQAVCWEVSTDLRELVRLTGIRPVTLLYARSLVRWWTIVCSLLLLTPLVLFANTLGGITAAHLIACGWALLMLMAVTAGLAMIAGISATEVQNASTTAAMGTFLLMLLYHLMFWMILPVLNVVMWLTTGEWAIPPGSWCRTIYDFAWQSAPLASLMRATSMPSLFSPWEPTFWIHFPLAGYMMRMATIVMINRFQTIRTVEVQADSSGKKADSRPRCTNAPLFWKDSQILVGGSRSRRIWLVLYLLGTLAVVLLGMSGRDSELPLAAGLIAICAVPIIFSVRLDSLIAAEFREQTWQSLMLLPIDRRTLIWAKFKAVAWEQQGALALLLIAVVFAARRSPTAVFMVAVIANLSGLMMCQVSAAYYLTPKHFWTGPVRGGLFLCLITLCIVIWFSCGLWESFAMTVMLQLVTIVPIQHYIGEKLQEWTEAS